MLTKCANPACPTPFRYLREGKVICVDSPSGTGSSRHPVEHFWLCGSCCKSYDLVARRGIVSVIPKRGKPNCLPGHKSALRSGYFSSLRERKTVRKSLWKYDYSFI